MIDRNWKQCFNNNSDGKTYFYLHYYSQKGITYPAYDDLQKKPTLILCEKNESICLGTWPAAFTNGTLGHMYAFNPDTLARYSWEEVIAKKKYWFTATPCRSLPIDFPEEFEYMGN